MGGAEIATQENRRRERRILARDVLAIVLTGMVLGLAFNQLGLASRPPRGLPWIGAARSLESVERVAVPADGSPGVSTPAAEPVVAERAPVTPMAKPAAVVPSSPDAIPDTASASDPPPGIAGLRVGLPVIPDLGRPLKVEIETVARFVEAGAALVVDARESAAFAAGHLPGAISVPYDEVAGEPARLAALDARGRPVIVYCSGGTCEQSRMLAELMVRDFGMRRVLVYEGGFAEWAAAGNAVAKVSP